MLSLDLWMQRNLQQTETAQKPVKVETVILGTESKFSVQEKQCFKEKKVKLRTPVIKINIIWPCISF